MLELTNKGPVVLLTGCQTPAAIRRSGTRRIETWLRNRKVRGAATLAMTAVEAAEAQETALPGEKLAAAMMVRLAKGVMALDEEIAERDALIEARFREHPHAEVIVSSPAMGKLMGAVFLAATGGDMGAFGGADRLAEYAGLAPAPRDSARVRGNLRRPTRFHRGLLQRDASFRPVEPEELPGVEGVPPIQAGRGEGTQAGTAGTRAPPPSTSCGP